MKPTPRKLALLMALAGGVSAPESVAAAEDPTFAAHFPMHPVLDLSELRISRLCSRESALADASVETLTVLAPLPSSEPLSEPTTEATAEATAEPSAEPLTEPLTEPIIESEAERPQELPAVPTATPSAFQLAAAPAADILVDPRPAETSAEHELAEALAMIAGVERPEPSTPARVASAIDGASAMAALAFDPQVDDFEPAPVASAIELAIELADARANARLREGGARAAAAFLAGDSSFVNFELDLVDARTLPAGAQADAGLDLSSDAMQAAFTRHALDIDLDLDLDAGERTVSRTAAVDFDIDFDIDFDVGPMSAHTMGIDVDIADAASPRAPMAVDIAVDMAVDLDLDLDVANASSPRAPIVADIDLDWGGSPDVGASTEASREAGTPGPFGDAKVAVLGDDRLDRVRGGFTNGAGLEVSFGIERAVYVNGVLVTTTSLNVSGLGSAPSVGPGAPIAPGTASLVQLGSGNTSVIGALDAATLGTVVQNTLNNQKIQTVTLVNATVNSLQVVKSMNIGASLRGALIDSLRR
jgi:hypothetical protein